MTTSRGILYLQIAIALSATPAGACAAESDGLLAVTRVSIHVEETQGHTAIDSLFQQAGLAAPGWPVTSPSVPSSKPASLNADINRLPFWEAVQSLGQHMGIEPVEVILFDEVPDRHNRRIEFQLAALSRAEAACGPFLFEIFVNDGPRNDSIPDEIRPPFFDNGMGQKVPMDAFSPICQLAIRTLIDPATTLAAWKSPILTSVTDAAGHAIAIIPDKNVDETWLSWQRDARQLITADTPYRTTSALSNGKLTVRGHAQFLIVDEMSKIEFSDLSRPSPKPQRNNQGQTFSMGDLVRDAGSWSIPVSFTRGNLDATTWKMLEAGHCDVTITDARGRSLAWTSSSYEGGGTGEARMHFSADQLYHDYRAQYGPPDRLVWRVPDRARWVDVPFEVTDLEVR